MDAASYRPSVAVSGVVVVENTKVGPFLILERLGNNRRQQVFHARQIEQNVDVALKFIGMPDLSIRARAIDKIQIEIDLLKKLDHENLVQILGAGVEGDQIFFAYELIKGESLTVALARRGKLAADQVVDYGSQIARVLDYLHDQDIIHSKLTPDKILITREGVIKVSDVRLNRSRKRRWDSSRKRELDIAAYMAPEQFKEGATAKSDIYSLGVILYEMLTGRLPCEPDTLGRLARKKMQDKAPSIAAQVMNCPVWLDRLVCQMISPNPRQRPHTMKAVILALEELRRVDETQTSAVSQVTGSFNPLTAGADKSEANRILGRKKPDVYHPPFFQSTWFLVSGLILILAILVIAMLPASSQSELKRAQLLMASENPDDWVTARDSLNSIINKGSADELFDEAELLYYESRRRTLEMQAERGRTIGLQSQESRRFVEAVKLQQNNELDSARNILHELVDSVDPEGKERHIFVAAKNRFDQISNEQQLAEVDEIRMLVGETRSAESRSEIQAAQRQLDELATSLDLLPGSDERTKVRELMDQVTDELRSRQDDEPQLDPDPARNNSSQSPDN